MVLQTYSLCVPVLGSLGITQNQYLWAHREHTCTFSLNTDQLTSKNGGSRGCLPICSAIRNAFPHVLVSPYCDTAFISCQSNGYKVVSHFNTLGVSLITNEFETPLMY